MTDQQPLNADATHDALFIIDNTRENGTCLGYLKACTKSSSALARIIHDPLHLLDFLPPFSAEANS